MGRESDALFAALGHRPTETPSPDLATLTPDQWSAVAALARQKRVGALLGWTAGALLPASTRAELTDTARATAMRTLRFQAELMHLARRLAPHGIELLVLKGLHLATSVYPTPGLREMIDIDVLVRLEHLERVATHAAQLGYVPIEATDLRIALLTDHHLPRLFKKGVGLEIHWRLAPQAWPPVVAPEDLWRRSEPSPLAPNIRQLGPEDVLLHICAHATSSHHLDQGLRPLCDVAAIVAKHGGQLKWRDLANRAAAWQCERGVALVLTLAQQLLGVDVPSVATDALAHCRPTEAVLHTAQEQLVASSPVVGTVSEAAGRLLSARNTRERLRIIRERIHRHQEPVSSLPEGVAPAGLVGQFLYAWHRTWDLLVRYPTQFIRLSLPQHRADRQFLARRSAIAEWLRNG